MGKLDLRFWWKNSIFKFFGLKHDFVVLGKIVIFDFGIKIRFFDFVGKRDFAVIAGKFDLRFWLKNFIYSFDIKTRFAILA